VTDRTRRALALLAAALVLGVSGDVLRTWIPARLDFALFVSLFLVTATALAHFRAIPAPPRAGWLAGVAWLLVACLIWRDAEALFALNLLGLAGVLAIGAPLTGMRTLDRLGLSDLVRGSVFLGMETAAGPLPAVARDIAWAELPLTARTRRVGSVMMGLVAAVPVLLLFGGLFGEADPLFRQTLTDLLHFDLEHVFFAGFVAWVAAGALRGGFWREGRAPAWTIGSGGMVSGGALVGFLGGIAALFALFVGFQARELFLDSDQFQALTGVTIAEYARGGFFELLWVAILTLPLLLGADWLLGKGDAGEVRKVRWVTAALLVLLAPVLASAVHRMVLYVSYYGLTEDRFYALAFMAWLAALFAWYPVTVLRGRRSRFLPGALAGGYLLLLALNTANPDAVVAGVNLRRAIAGAPLDANYLARLSADALPTIVREASRLPAATRCEVALRLHERWDVVAPAAGPGAVWNFSRRRAGASLGEGVLDAAGCPPLDPERDQGTEARL